MIAIFLAPISPSINTNQSPASAKIEIQQNIASAQETILPLLPPQTNAAIAAYQIQKQTADDSYLVCFTGTKLKIGGCIAQIFYIVWEVSAWIGRLAGQFLDFFLKYSLDHTSYTNTFIEEGWGAVRDIANIFFILILLYIALKTVLSLNVSNNKRLISSVIIIALVINFSLFTTKVVIDSSNILAKIFYNQIKSVNEQGVPTDDSDPNNVKAVSVELVNKFDPQDILSKELYDDGKGAGKFIFLTLLLTGITLYTAYVFFSVALLFVSRVVMLWISMIMSPIAFISYAVPFNIPGLGHKQWWSELLKNAFLAPIFIFFLYLIVLFLDILKETIYKGSNNTTIQIVMAVIIPFMLLVVFLMKARKLAIEYSGEMGAAINKGGKMVAGLAGGLALGGAAALGAKAIGGTAARYMSKNGESLRHTASTSKGLKRFAARAKLKTLDYGTKATFDARKTKVGNFVSSKTGLNLQSALKSKEGGYEGWQKRREEKIRKQKDSYKTNMSDSQVRDWSAEERRKWEEERKSKNMSVEDFKKIKAIPKLYNNANELNADRLESFKESLPQGLIAKVAKTKASFKNTTESNYERNDTYKKEHKKQELKKSMQEKGDSWSEKDREAFDTQYKVTYDKDLATRLNKENVENSPLMIGRSFYKKSAEKTISSEIDKEIKEKSIRIERLKNRLIEQKENVTSVYDDPELRSLGFLKVNTKMNEKGQVEAARNEKNQVDLIGIDKDKLAQALSKNTVESESLRQQLAGLNKTLSERKDNERNRDWLIKESATPGRGLSDEQTKELRSLEDKISISSNIESEINTIQDKMTRTKEKGSKLKLMQNMEDNIEKTQKGLENLTGKKE